MVATLREYPGTGGLLRRLWSHLSPRRRLQFHGLFALMIMSAFAEMFSIGAVVPFLGVLVSPEKVLAHPVTGGLAQAMGWTTQGQLTVAVTCLFAFAAVLAGAMRLGVLHATTRLSFAAGVDLSVEVYRRTLYQPYSVHVARNSSEVISAIVNKVGANIHVLVQCLTLASASLLVLAISAALLVADSQLAALALFCFGGVYGLVSWFSRKRLARNSERIAQEQDRLLKALNEGLGGIRDVLLDGTQEMYRGIYERADRAVRRAQASNMLIAGAPRYVIEAAAMVFIAVLALFLSAQPGGILAALPAIGALALGAQRMLPSLQQAYAAWSGIAGSRASIADLLALLAQPLPPDQPQANEAAALSFTQVIEFKDIRFRYSPDMPWVIDGLNLRIKRGWRVGIVGSTGSGKSTATDLLMGLLAPVQGDLQVDGVAITAANLRAWQRLVAHVPQSIFLADASLAENIAFGVPPAQIDMQRVREAAQQAQIDATIQALPAAYRTQAGERGVRLSGGQRQRIGIARALYKQSKVLVFDEATSALDSHTEQAVMEAIHALDRDLTIVMIAHRLSTVRECDLIVEMEGGRMVAQGSFAELMERSSSFRRLAASLPV